jgi:hypothetical protein
VRGATPVPTEGHTARTRAALRRSVAVLTLSVFLGLAGLGLGQGGAGQAPASQAPTSQAAATPTRTVAVEPLGGPANLATDLDSAIAAWKSAAPKLVSLGIAGNAPSSIGYAAPALLGPDTLSIDLHVPGQAGTQVQLAPTAVAAHPMVLLHEVGVLLGLPEGTGGVMAFAVPLTGEPATPTSSDVDSLRARYTFAPEDLNHDGTVDFYDLVLFGQAFGAQGVNLPADFNADGQVDAQDLQLLTSAYTFSPPSQTAPAAQPTPAAQPAAPASTEPAGAAPGGTPKSAPGGN